MADLQGTTFEQHYTAEELAELWHFDSTTIRRWFRDEAGVLVQGIPGIRRGKRACCHIRIPASVAERVYRQRTR